MILILRQTWALLFDAYRELNARKLFWLTLLLSALVVSSFAMIGLNENGFALLVWQFDHDYVNTKVLDPFDFYLFIYSTFGISIWLTWAATILALVSTAPIIPDFISAGSIELTLCKPIGRVRLFLTKFLGGLLFTGLQVLLFSLACFLVIGFRGGTWVPEVFWAVPIVMVFYSYLHAICALFGLLTGSATTALLLTMLVWFALFIVNTADSALLQVRAEAEVRLHEVQVAIQRRTDVAERIIEQARANGNNPELAEGAVVPEGSSDLLEVANPLLARSRNALEPAERGAKTWIAWHQRVVMMRTYMPKTTDTINLLQRYAIDPDELRRVVMAISGDNPDSTSRKNDPDSKINIDSNDPAVIKRALEIQNDRSLTWIIGTSLAFEAVLLAIGCVYFSRRDF